MPVTNYSKRDNGTTLFKLAAVYQKTSLGFSYNSFFIGFCQQHICKFRLSFKGIVQRKLRWVESGVNRWVMIQYGGAGHYFLSFKGHHLVFRIKCFAAT